MKGQAGDTRSSTRIEVLVGLISRTPVGELEQTSVSRLEAARVVQVCLSLMNCKPSVEYSPSHLEVASRAIVRGICEVS